MSVTIEYEPTTNYADFDRRVTLKAWQKIVVTWLMASARAVMITSPKMGQNLLGMKVGTFVRIQKVIWDQQLPRKAEIIYR